MSRILFISSMTGYRWGGSEELWAGAAQHLQNRGHSVRSLVCRWKPEPPKLAALRDAGCRIRTYRNNLFIRGLRLGISLPFELVHVALQRASFVVISQGHADDGLFWMEACQSLNVPYATVVHAVNPAVWPQDSRARRLERAYRGAQRTFFVSQVNRALLEDQIGASLPDAETIWNPYGVPYDVQLPWPETPWRLAVVGRLAPESKGSDVILRALAGMEWKGPPPTVTFYGDGPCRETLHLLKKRLRLQNVVFGGHCPDIVQVWKENHLLMLASRYEGRPLAVVEAMLCARPSLVTFGSGGDEIIEHERHGYICPASTEPLLRHTLHQAWANRSHWERMGQDAAKHIRGVLPKDPCAGFATTIESLASRSARETNASRPGARRESHG
jgi:glycosyltransferase involved in cell wall biosynthesis